MIYQHEFKNNRPSLASIEKQIRTAVRQGADYITLTWGENQITLERVPGTWTRSGWVGHGWIGRNGGQDIANRMPLNQGAQA